MKSLFVLLMLLGFECLGQNFAVLLARDDASAPAGFPTNWPVRVQPIGAASQLPPEFPPPWRFATKAQVDKWMADHAAEMEAYQAARKAEETQPARDRDAAIRNAIADLKLIRDSSGTLTPAQLSNAVRALSKALIPLIEELKP